MLWRETLAWICLTALAAAASACAAPVPTYQFEPTECAAEIVYTGAQCGSVSVPEDYEAPNGRSIALRVAILRSTNTHSNQDPLFELEGGPGVPVTQNISFYATDGAIYHRDRDVVFVDMRGTGGSNPLRCTALESYAQSEPSAPLYPPDLVAACATELSQRADLNQYTTANAVRDVDAVRQAIGAERIAIDALSYGTTLALAYVTEHPDRVSAAVLTSTVPADRTPPRFHANAASTALSQIFAACAAEAACYARFPAPAADFERARRRFTTPEDAEVFSERIRTMMYAPTSARRIPLFLQEAARGAAPEPSYATPTVADGLYLSITCAESFTHFDLESARAEARLTPFGDYRLRRQAAACAVWPVASAAPRSTDGPVATPVLFVSGTYDPVSPAEWTEDVMSQFPNARHITIDGGGHVVDGLSNLDTCYDPMIVRFFDTRDARTLDARCLGNVRPPSFALE